MIEFDINMNELDIILDEIEEYYDLHSGLYTKEIAYKILKEAQRLCPVDTGKLRDSGKVIQDGEFYRVVFDVDYAYAVHEDMSKKHKKGTAKFLDIAIQKVMRE